ncbi:MULTISPECIES: hypothetical protein [unclassified Rickettsia]|uniref:hypothetical protein n=1 Tax=unclassified Rickettsia TaxID=114295 RepID=UPI003132B63A
MHGSILPRHCEEGRSLDAAIQEKISTKCYVNYYFLDYRVPFVRGFVAWLKFLMSFPRGIVAWMVKIA